MRSNISLTVLVLSTFFFVLSSVRDVNAGDVEFYFKSFETKKRYCIICTGPAHRSSGLHYFDTPRQESHFYTASDGLGAPYGDWTCYWNPANDLIDEARCLGPRGLFEFRESFEIPKNIIALNIVSGAGGTFLFFPLRDISAAAETGDASADTAAPQEVQTAALGDDSSTEKPDRDTFTFDAVEGDSIVLRVVGDPAKGHIGSLARLKLRRAGDASGELAEEGSVPLTLETTISESGTYEVVVEQENKNRDDWYRGDYFIVLRPGIAELTPSEDVEF